MPPNSRTKPQKIQSLHSRNSRLLFTLRRQHEVVMSLVPNHAMLLVLFFSSTEEVKNAWRRLAGTIHVSGSRYVSMIHWRQGERHVTGSSQWAAVVCSPCGTRPLFAGYWTKMTARSNHNLFSRVQWLILGVRRKKIVSSFEGRVIKCAIRLVCRKKKYFAN